MAQNQRNTMQKKICCFLKSNCGKLWQTVVNCGKLWQTVHFSHSLLITENMKYNDNYASSDSFLRKYEKILKTLFFHLYVRPTWVTSQCSPEIWHNPPRTVSYLFSYQKTWILDHLPNFSPKTVQVFKMLGSIPEKKL